MSAIVERLARLSVSGLADQFDKLGKVPPVLARELKPIGAAGVAMATVLRRPEVEERLDGLAMDVCVIEQCAVQHSYRRGIMRSNNGLAQATFAALLACTTTGAAAQSADYPNRPIRLVAPFAPGGSTDTVARILAQRLTQQMGQNVIVDNRTGAGGTIGADLVARAAPDGYTLQIGDFGPNVVAGALYANLAYDPVQSFTHVSLAVTFPLVLVTPASSPIHGLKDYIERSRSKQSALRYGSAGVGTSPHVFMELLQNMAKIETLHVPYKGGAPAVVGVMAGEVDSAMVAVSTAVSQLSAGKIKALGVTSATPSARLPGVPAISSLVPGYEGLNFHGLHAPAGLSAPIALRLSQEVYKAVRSPESKERLDGLAMDAAGSSPAEYDAFIRQQVKQWVPFVKSAGIRAN